MLSVLVVRSDDPAILLRLAGAAHQDADSASLAARLLDEDGQVTVMANAHVVFDAETPAAVSAGRSFPTVTGLTTTASGQPKVTFERIPHDVFRMNAEVDDDTGIIEGFLAIDGREPDWDDAGHVEFTGDMALERSFVVARNAEPTAQVLRPDILLIVSAGLVEKSELRAPEPVDENQPDSTSAATPNDTLPPGADTPRGRRQRIDALLGRGQ